ncbi:MAG: hypothetical protein WC141_09210 [Arcobacteraceae bacterium]
MNNEIDFDIIEDVEFNTFIEQDKKANFLNKRKKILKGTIEEKTERIGLKFTLIYKEDLEKYKTTLGVKTFNALLYKLIELGKEQHKKQLKKILKNKENQND